MISVQASSASSVTSNTFTPRASSISDRGRDVLGAEDHQVREVVGGDGLLAGRRHDEHVREAARRHAVQADDAVLPLLLHRDAVAADDGVTGAAWERRELRFEAGGVDDAVELVLGVVGDRAVRR